MEEKNRRRAERNRLAGNGAHARGARNSIAGVSDDGDDLSSSDDESNRRKKKTGRMRGGS